MGETIQHMDRIRKKRFQQLYSIRISITIYQGKLSNNYKISSISAFFIKAVIKAFLSLMNI